MENKFYMEQLLSSVKGLSNLLLNATIEASTDDVHATFNNCLFDTLAMQNAIYKQMEAKGYYAAN